MSRRLDVYECLHDQARRCPEAVALIHDRAGGTQTTTFGELGAQAARFAEFVTEATSRSRIVPLFMAKSAQCVAAMFGVIGAGKAFACLNRKLRGPQLCRILENIGSPAALTDAAGLMALADGLEMEAIRDTHWWVIDGWDHRRNSMNEMVQKLRNKGLEVDPLDLSSGGAVKADPELDRSAEPDGDPGGILRPGACLFTSGSTGVPKGVLISRDDLAARAAAEIDCFGLTPEDVLLSVLPFSFDVGLNQLFSAVICGCRLVLSDSWLPADILRATAKHRVSGISGVPAIWQEMFAARMSFKTRGEHASLRFITVSGGDLTSGQLERLPNLAPGTGIFKTYGQSETFRSTALKPDEFASKRTSVGKAFGGAKVYIVRQDGSPCHANEEGEIVHTGPGVMLGYLDGSDPQGKLRPNPFRAEGDPAAQALYTGDLGYFDHDGYLYIVGRRDGMLKVAGNRVYPREIVDELLRLAGVKAAEVVGVKDEQGATHLVALVVADQSNGESASTWVAELRRELSRRLASFMIPRQIVVLESIPRTASGKPDVPALIELAGSALKLKPSTAESERVCL